MNFFKRKRKHDDEKELEEREPKKSRIVSLIQKAGHNLKGKIAVAVKALTSRTYSQDVKSFLFTTPAGPLRSARYIMTPAEPFSAVKSALEWRNHSYYILGTTIEVTESHHHEFKTGGGNYPISILPEHVRKYGSAFLNSDGGVLMAGILDDGTVRGICCPPAMRKRITDSVHREFSEFLPKVDPSFYSVKFVPITQPQNYRERQEGRHTFVNQLYVVEIIVKAGVKGELYETNRHQVFIRRESSVQGPLNPLQIKDIVIQKYREIIEQRRLNAVDPDLPTCAEEVSSEKKNHAINSVKSKKHKTHTPSANSKSKKVIVISP